MKKPIEWHEECLHNAVASAIAKRAQAEKLLREADAAEERNYEKLGIIVRAREMGIKEFDPDKIPKAIRK